MSLERTQQQSTHELKKARDLSLEPTRPPAQVPGYKMQQFLGSGAYGEVWAAIDQKTGRRVAIKFYTRRSSTDVELLAREVEKLVVLAADRYVVQLLDVGWDANPPFYVMDYIEHGSLEDRLNQQQGMPASDAVELFTEIASGMMHLHGKGILHCDLKPGNVLLDQDGKPRVADFGQSRLSTEETAALGTLFFMAPEQADLKAVPDAKWDVYGLGALLYCMLTGKPPYYCPELAKRIEAQLDIADRLAAYRTGLQTAAKPIEHRSVAGVDRALADIVDRCIESDPKKRFSNIQSVLLALRQRELAKARKPLMVLGLLGPLVLVGVMSLFGWWAFRQAVNRSELEITKKAIESNEFAAKLAARSAAEQIDEYFRVVGQLSRDPKFKQDFETVIRDQELEKIRAAIADPANNSKDFVEPDPAVAEWRAKFKRNKLPIKLQSYLDDRLNNVGGDFPVAASWFVNDRFGNQIASAFEEDNKTLGNNYAYRSYFSGTDRDLKQMGPDGETEIYLVEEDVHRRKIITEPYLSAVFISEQSNTWKVAFSAPIRIDDQVEGVVAVTVDLGNFVEFDTLPTHYAMMVDVRLGANQGIVLEHPLFQALLRDTGRIPHELTSRRLDLTSLFKTDHVVEPMDISVGDDSGHENALSLVVKADVRVEADSGGRAAVADENSTDQAVVRKETGLVVLAVEDYASIIAPAKDLSRQLGQLAALAALFLFVVTIGMWLFVNRMLRESRRRLDRAFSPSGGTSLKQANATAAVSPNTPRVSMTEEY